MSSLAVVLIEILPFTLILFAAESPVIGSLSVDAPFIERFPPIVRLAAPLCSSVPPVFNTILPQ